MSTPPPDVQRLKQQIRLKARANRREQSGKDQLSREICRKLAALPEYAAATTVMFYVDVRSEVRTRPFLPSAWKQGKQVVVPYCAGGRLELFRLESIRELAAGTLQILEPKVELRGRADRKADVSQLDLIVAPGLAFDRRGGRLGHGGSYYDRLACQVRPDAALVALAFECQLFPAIPMQPHDVYMDRIITEKAIYERPRA